MKIVLVWWSQQRYDNYSNKRPTQKIFKRTKKLETPGILEKPAEGIILSCSEFCKYSTKKNIEYLNN